ncbi:MAG: methylated-DNA--[protein]-cysteine S-methyltransferase [Promicromonosporaceae bacterium]|nr:methylated-DNA--[protein]-cysteine S-methyltransferase [Promicromonosporaceae bacterium]
MTSFATVTTPDGPFTVVTSDGAVLASGWTPDVEDLLELIHPTLRPAAPSSAVVGPRDSGHEGSEPESQGPTTGENATLAQALDAVGAYYDGDLDAPAAVPVRQVSGEFRQHAWDVLRDVAPGEVVTYTEYAARAGRPSAVRAAAGACAMNAAALFVPCHRVLRTDGTLGGFRYGLEVKSSLLTRESLGR